jgi:hypothetical protein
MKKKVKKSDNGNGLYLGAASVKNGSKGAATRAGSTPKDPGRLKRDAKQKDEEMKRVMDYNRKKQQKRPLASGRADSFTDEVGQGVIAGIITAGGSLRSKGISAVSKYGPKMISGKSNVKITPNQPEYEFGERRGAIRAKTPAKMDRTYIRKAKEVKSIKKIEKKPKK